MLCFLAVLSLQNARIDFLKGQARALAMRKSIESQVSQIPILEKGVHSFPGISFDLKVPYASPKTKDILGSAHDNEYLAVVSLSSPLKSEVDFTNYGFGDHDNLFLLDSIVEKEKDLTVYKIHNVSFFDVFNSMHIRSSETCDVLSGDPPYECNFNPSFHWDDGAQTVKYERLPQLPEVEFGYGATAQVKVIFDFSLFWIGASLDLDVSIEGELGVGIRFEEINRVLEELSPIRIPQKLWSLPFDLIGFNINAAVDLGLSFGVRDLDFHFPAFNYYKGYLYKINS